MSLHVNFAANGKELGDAYQAVLSASDPTNWLLYSYEKGSNDLRVQGTGDGGLEELYDEFSDGKIQYAYARVIDPNTELPKFVFIAWCGSGVPESRKGFFNSHVIQVSDFFKTYHVQINARDEADVEPELIMKRVAESSGAKYSVHKEQSRPQPAVTPVGSVYKKTEIPNIAAMQRESMKKDGPPARVGTNYQPVHTAPKPLAGRWNPGTQDDSGAANVRAERERAEREARDREQEQAQRNAAADQERLQREEAEQRAIAEQQAEQARLQQEQEEAQRRAAEAEREAVAAQREADEQQQREAEAAAAQAKAEATEAEEERRRQQAKVEAAREEDQRRQTEEAERRHKEEEAARRMEEERRQREEEKQAALQGQLDQTADRAVHSAQHAAGVAMADSETAGTHGQSAVVLFGYTAAESNEMTLLEGEIVVQIDQVDEGWWFGVSEDGRKQGLFPSNYVQLIEEEEPQSSAAAASTAPAPSAQQEQQQQQEQPVTEDVGHSAIALYDYQAGEDNEISFKENDRIIHIEFVSDDWWQGVAPDGKTVGLFPANYVELQR
ncbi:hypothetical protein BCR43DRAFT_485770 [Syncephalastrum racemosum]|uniref:ADF-H domain-containing protein n=1 Tax=Syncephalastrum racemosum TaxID=13706 RepID=A0A1X2HN76_SYNRA|nr:hypothetical protein BCR43DRAFT_485770 [Syncephalastrum racemosum]